MKVRFVFWLSIALIGALGVYTLASHGVNSLKQGILCSGPESKVPWSNFVHCVSIVDPTGKVKGFGSGIQLDETTFLISAHQVQYGVGGIMLKDEFYPAELLWKGDAALEGAAGDLAAVKLKKQVTSGNWFTPVINAHPALGQAVYLVGYPEKGSDQVSGAAILDRPLVGMKASVVRSPEGRPTKAFYVIAAVPGPYQGFSGGGAFILKGDGSPELIGIITQFVKHTRDGRVEKEWIAIAPLPKK